MALPESTDAAARRGERKIAVAIVDDHAAVRSGLRGLMAAEPDMHVAGEARDGRDAMDLALLPALNVLVMDVVMPHRSGLDALARIRARAPAVAVLIFTAYDDAAFALSAFRQGARGFLGKGCEPGEILRAVRTVSDGRRYIAPEVAERMLSNRYGDLPHHQLTERELQIFMKLAAGLRPCAVANALCLSAKTISTYRARLMQKLELHSNSDLTYYALKHRLID